MPAAPIIVSGPMARSGTTLIQRLISSSENGICYGAEAARRLLALAEFTHSECVSLQENAQLQSYYLQHLLSGNQSFGSIDLEIPGELPRHALVGALTFFKQHYDEATKAIEKEIWACKSPQSSFISIVKTADFIPDLKCVYIYRNIVDTIRSQKSLGLINDDKALVGACMQWNNNTDVIAALRRKNFEQIPEMLLPIKFETLLSDRNNTIRRLEEFMGVSAIQHDVANHKVNRCNPTSETDPTPVLSYVEPAQLSDVELHMISHVCRDRMAEIYPEKLALLHSEKLSIQ